MHMDLIAAKANEAQAVLSCKHHADVWSTLEAKTVDQTKLASLAIILSGQVLNDASVIEHMQSFVSLADGGDNGPWLSLVPSALVEQLARLQEGSIAQLASSWANTEEAKLDRWNQDEVAAFLRRLSEFASSARAENKDVLLWVCL